MSDAIYKTASIIGSSTEGIKDAIGGVVGKVAHYQAGLKSGFRLN